MPLLPKGTILIFTILIIIFTPTFLYAEHLHPEKKYAAAWCTQAHGKTEFKLRDNTRVDCLTKNYAVEFDFADKWAEALGQALHYGRLTGEKPAIVLIIEQESDWEHYWKLKKLARKEKVKLWYIQPEYFQRYP